MVQPHHNFAPYLQIETKFMTRNKIFFYRFISFSKSFGKLATWPDILITKAKSDCIGRHQFRVLIYHKHVNTLDGPNY